MTFSDTPTSLTKAAEKKVDLGLSKSIKGNVKASEAPLLLSVLIDT